MLFSVFVLMSLVGFKAQAVANVDVNALKEQVAALQDQITALLQQLAEAEKTPVVWCYDFNVNLRIGDKGAEVEALQIALTKEFGRPAGNMDDVFDEFTASSVVEFQQKYHAAILAPWRLKYGTGYAGRTTLAKLTAIYGCGVVRPIPIPIPIEPYITVISPNGGEQWVVGNSYNITWKVNGLKEGSINITDDEGNEAVLVPRIYMKEGINSFSWTIGGSFTPFKKESRKWEDAQGYKILIYSNGQKDTSDNYFSIVVASDCTQEGGIKCNVMGCKSCCGGLEERDVLTQIKNNLGETVCVEEMSQTVCVKCGDGICGLGESFCNCPTDCPTEATEPYITVTSPNKGEQWKLGEAHTIQWSTSLNSDSGGSFIALMKGDGSDMVGYIAGVISDNQPIIWDTKTIAYSRSGETFQIKPGTYRIRVAILDLSIQKTTIFVDSDSFSIVEKEVICLQVITPAVSPDGVCKKFSTPCDVPYRWKVVSGCLSGPSPWDWNYCTAGAPCSTGQGDCDTNADCSTGYCAHNVGVKYGQVAEMDVCEEKIVASIMENQLADISSAVAALVEEIQGLFGR